MEVIPWGRENEVPRYDATCVRRVIGEILRLVD